MKYRYKPEEVEAFEIREVVPHVGDAGCDVVLPDGSQVECDLGMTARYYPEIGDYLVRSSDGYVYLNPKAVFERKFEVVSEEAPKEVAPPVVKSSKKKGS